jgi:MoaA/NifB/PqqE/SkfB family radical SAM enzyme
MRINKPARILQNARRIRKYGVFSSSLRIDASSVCQLRCPCCIQTRGERGVIGSGFLTPRDFKRFLDSYPEFDSIELANAGEVFLNPDIDEIISCAFEKGVRLSISSGTNFNTVSPQTIENLVKYKVGVISVSLDGATDDIYRIYRQGGNFDTVIRNVRLLNEFKKKYNSDLPKVLWQFVAFGHNEHQIPHAQKMAADLDMEFRLKLNFNPEYSPVTNKEVLRQEIGASNRQEYEKNKKKPYLTLCSQLWLTPQINWDGKLLGCCKNYWGDFGNVFESGLKECLKGEKYVHAIKMITGKAQAKEGIPCSTCPNYEKMNANDTFYPSPFRIVESAKAILKR